ncbi:hypothetical protein ACFE04_009778 [Oxalis oulophora]
MTTPAPSPPSSPRVALQSWSAPATPAATYRATFEKASNTKTSNSKKIMRKVRSVFRAFPIIQPACRAGMRLTDGHGGMRMTGTLFGFRRSRVNFIIQENPRGLPVLLLEFSMQTGKLLQEMGMGLVRIVLECEKKPKEKTKIVDESIWILYCNGKKSGYAVKREPTDEDLSVIHVLQAMTMGAGVLPSDSSDGGDLTYMRSNFERVVNSKDSETYYMMNPDGNCETDLSIFFVRN